MRRQIAHPNVGLIQLVEGLNRTEMLTFPRMRELFLPDHLQTGTSAYAYLYTRIETSAVQIWSLSAFRLELMPLAVLVLRP